MRSRSLVPLVLVGLVLAACGTGAGQGATDSSVAVQPTTTAAPGAAASAPTAPPATEARPAAPDFSLALGDGGTFVLSEETKPVYLVFWAEW